MSEILNRSKWHTPHGQASLGVAIHTAAVFLLYLFIVNSTGDYPFVMWFLFVLIDFPISIIVVALHALCDGLFGASGSFYHNELPALLFTVAGGTQWYYLVRHWLRAAALRNWNRCSNCGSDLSEVAGGTCPACGTARMCFACGYNLTGNVSGVCPECGSTTR